MLHASQAADSFVSQREAEESRRRHEAHEKATEKALQLRLTAMFKQEMVCRLYSLQLEI